MTASRNAPLRIGGVALTVHDRLAAFHREVVGLHDLGGDPAHTFHGDVLGTELTGSAA